MTVRARLGKEHNAMIKLFQILVFAAAVGCSGSAKASEDIGFARVGSWVELLMSLPGCRSEATLDKVRALINQGDTGAEWELLSNELATGNCRIFTKDASVFVSDRAILRGRVAIRSKGDPNDYWIPNAAVDSDQR
jgi:hypothetical protein